MTVLSGTVNVNQTWINTTPTPWEVSSGTTINFTSNLAITISGGQTQFFTLQNSTNNITINGGGYKVTINNTTGSNTYYYGLIVIAGTATFQNVIIENIGLIIDNSTSNINITSGLFNFDGDISSSSTFNLIIRRCYTFGDIGVISSAGNAAGIFRCGGSSIIDPSTSYLYIHDCYHIGNIGTISNTTTNCGGIVNSVIGKLRCQVFISNCYYIGLISGTTNAGGIIGGEDGGNQNTYLHLINCYLYGSGNIYQTPVQTSPGYFGLNKILTVITGSWNDSTANSSLYSQESGGTQLDATEITTTGAYSTVSGTINTTYLTNFASYLSSYEGVSPYYSYFKFPSLTNQPWGIRYFYDITPYQSIYYTQATDEAANCFCKGTKITIINEFGKKIFVPIENVKKGMIVMTPHRKNKKVLHIGRFWYEGSKPKHMPYLIKKDYFKKNIPFEDTYVSGAHSLIYTKKTSAKFSLTNGRKKERGLGMKLHLVKDFGELQDFQKVSILKGENNLPYGFYYYHIVVEENYGFFANRLSSESLEIKDFINNFEEIL